MKEEVFDYTDHRAFRNDLDAYLNAGVKLEVAYDPAKGLMRILLLEVTG